MNRELLKADFQFIIDNRKKVISGHKQKMQPGNIGLSAYRQLEVACILLESQVEILESLIQAVDAGRYDAKPDLLEMTKGNVMNAQEARKKTELAKVTRINIELEKARRAIESTVASGKFTVNVNGISQDALQQLQAEGYTAKTTYDQRDGDFTTISW